ncbi:MAG: SMP-30/gluconolactonase/LRE family protein [Proteobacteria bacterium]|nr:SMP-30/gluconolactonase/LRE family protein [Pseudomonadota bacterium]
MLQQPTIFLTLLALAATPALAQVTAIDPGAHYPEGPLWHGGKLLYVEYSDGNIKSWDGKAGGVIWHQDGCGPSGLIERGQDLLIACYDGNYLVAIDSSGKELRQWRSDGKDRPFFGPNDFAADDRGGIYFSASGAYDIKAPATGALLYLQPDGKRITRLATGLRYPNGLAVMKDRRHLLVAEMLEGRLVSFQIGADGSLSDRKVWARLQDLAPPTPNADAYNGPDGLKLGPDGNYYIAQNGSGRVLVVGDDKKLVRAISVPTPYVTNVAFAGKSVFITGGFEQWKAPFPGAVYRWSY